MQFNWVDILFGVFFIYFVLRGWSQGVLYFIASVATMGASLWLAITYAQPFSLFLISKFNLSNSWAGIIAFFLISFAAEMIISELLQLLLSRLPRFVTNNIVNQFLGVLVSVTAGLFLLTLLLVFLTFLPLRGNIRQDIQSSFVVSKLITFVEEHSGPVPTLLKNSASKITKFMTIAPESKECVTLDAIVTAKNLKVDEISEDLMVTMVNTERQKVGASPLVANPAMTSVARAYAQQMLLGRFFCHYDPAGHDVAYRLQQSAIGFLVAGENLAYAPDLATAHTGLMNSEGHRRNILDTRFHKVGIGIIDAGPWGKMVVQIFTD